MDIILETYIPEFYIKGKFKEKGVGGLNLK